MSQKQKPASIQPLGSLLKPAVEDKAAMFIQGQARSYAWLTKMIVSSELCDGCTASCYWVNADLPS